jgi:hypothetical protein
MTKEVLQEALKAARVLHKATRQTIKDPSKLCDCCMSEWTNFTLKQEKFCDEYYEEVYGKTEVE